MQADTGVTREPTLIEFHRQPADAAVGGRRWLARGQNFFVEWVEAGADGAGLSLASRHEAMVLVFGATARIDGGDAAAVQAAARSVCILPPGVFKLRLGAGGACAVLASQRDDLADRLVLNQASFAEADPRIVPSTPAFRRRSGGAGIRVVPIDSFTAPADNPRLKMLQSATLSINWVEYDGVRDRRSLSPHSHADLEQGSLGVDGRFVHHLREAWGKNADLWREDRHDEVASPSLMVVPVNLIHTSEGVGDGHHLLIDIFSPPRRDFIAKRWVANASDYEESTP